MRRVRISTGGVFEKAATRRRITNADGPPVTSGDLLGQLEARWVKIIGGVSMKRVLLACAVLPFAVINPAYSQSDLVKAVQDKLTAGIAKLQSACSEDIKKYCSNVTPGEGRVLHCMQAYEDKISPQCGYAEQEAALNLQMTVDRLKEAVLACNDDIAKLCSKTQPGQGRVAQCLIANKSAASAQCAGAIQKLQTAIAK
jgi:Cysteine rich repeat